MLGGERLESRDYLSATSLWDPLQQIAIAPLSINGSTGQKPQSKLWESDGDWWGVLPNGTGTWLWRLDSTTWTPIVQLSSSTSSAADVKVDGDLAHILLFEGPTSELVTLEAKPGTPNGYDFWSVQPLNVTVPLGSSVETATIDIDSTGRLWVAYDRSSTIEVRYSDGPYTSFSAPITVASGITSDDISSIIAMPGGKIGVFWSNQNSERFGFRTHLDGTNAQTWTADELPASQSAKGTGNGFADDHVHLATASDGTLYVAAKTSYDTSGSETVILLVRRPNGIWDNAYNVDNTGTRAVVVVNEAHQEVAIVYTDNTGGGDIVLRATPLGAVQLGPKQVVMSGNLDDTTTAKAISGDELLVLATKGGNAVGSLISLGPSTGGGGGGGGGGTTNTAPVVNAGADQTITLPGSAALVGTVTDDGLPGPTTTTWTKVSGPGTVTFTTANAASTTANFNLAGTYILQLTGNDGSLQASDQITIQVQAAVTPPPPGGLVGWWTLDAGGADQSGLANNGTTAGTTSVVAGKSGNALRVASNGRLVVPDNASLDMTTAITMSAWIKPEKSGTQVFVGKKDSGVADGYELSLSSDGTIFARFNDKSKGDTYRVNSSTKYPTNGQTWIHVAATYDGTTIRLYINGKLEASKAAKFQIGTNNVALGLGAEQDGYRGMTGAIDEVRLYSRALSAQEVAALISVNPPPPPQNTAPVVNAGADQTITLPNGATLNGTVSDDGLPTPGSTTSVWSKVSGPGTVTFANASAAATTATFSAAGTYVLQLAADDGSLQASDQLTVQVQSQPQVGDGLVGWWSMDNGGADQSGQGNNGTTAGSTSVVAGKSGNALRVASNGRVVVPDSSSLDMTQTITMAAWIKPEKSGTQYFIDKKDTGNVDGYELSMSSDGHVFVRFNEASKGDSLRVNSTSKYPTNGQTWMFVAATYDGTTIKLYVNGKLEASKTASFAIGMNNIALGLGAEQDGYRGMTGAIDDVRIYSRALSAQEITALYNL